MQPHRELSHVLCLDHNSVRGFNPCIDQPGFDSERAQLKGLLLKVLDRFPKRWRWTIQRDSLKVDLPFSSFVNGAPSTMRGSACHFPLSSREETPRQHGAEARRFRGRRWDA